MQFPQGHRWPPHPATPRRLEVRRSERDRGVRPGLTTYERDRLKALERENSELRQANEILRKASAYFAARRRLSACAA
jgi:transposase-like protein